MSIFFELLPHATTDFSPIESLVINNDLQVTEFSCRLVIRHLHFVLVPLAEPSRIELNHFTHVSVGIRNLEFLQFAFFMKDILSHVEVLHISIGNDETYLDANQWKEGILSSMPRLRIFNVLISYRVERGKSASQNRFFDFCNE